MSFVCPECKSRTTCYSIKHKEGYTLRYNICRSCGHRFRTLEKID